MQTYYRETPYEGVLLKVTKDKIYTCQLVEKEDDSPLFTFGHGKTEKEARDTLMGHLFRCADWVRGAGEIIK